jgi:hypothetical protein
MRWKIIIVNAGIVALVAALSFVLLATKLRDIVSDPGLRKAEVERAIRSANAQLELDGLRMERWLAEQVSAGDVRAVFAGGTASARSESATAQANRIRDAAVREPGFTKMAPSLVLFVDAQGVGIGRDGSNLLRGDKVADFYPSLAEALKSGHTMSDVWLKREREEQLLASYAPVRGEDGEIAGAVVVGTPLNDERLSRTSDLTSGRPLVVGVAGQGKQVEIIAQSSQTTPEALALAKSAPVLGAAEAALAAGNLAIISGASDQFILGTAPLAGYGASAAALIAAAPASLVGTMTSVLWPVFAVAVLGILLVVAGGFVLGNFISEPISEIEEGLLQIINGKTDLRFQLEHPELGGLIFRINSLLNALMGVPETDEEGRTSSAPGQPY